MSFFFFFCVIMDMKIQELELLHMIRLWNSRLKLMVDHDESNFIAWASKIRSPVDDNTASLYCNSWSFGKVNRVYTALDVVRTYPAISYTFIDDGSKEGSSLAGTPGFIASTMITGRISVGAEC